MRGADTQLASLFSSVQLEDRIPADHPLRVIRTLIDPMLLALSPRFDALYSPHSRCSIARSRGSPVELPVSDGRLVYAEPLGNLAL